MNSSCECNFSLALHNALVCKRFERKKIHKNISLNRTYIDYIPYIPYISFVVSYIFIMNSRILVHREAVNGQTKFILDNQAWIKLHITRCYNLGTFNSVFTRTDIVYGIG